jgi:ribonuclease T2
MRSGTTTFRLGGAGARLAAIVAICVLASAPVLARSHHRTRHEAGKPGLFSYYLLSLSYAPDFCAQPSGRKDARECGAGRGLGFLVHGLWPQADRGRGPEDCGSSGPVAQSVVAATLNYIPSESLIQHEWTTHGTCSGMAASAYFALVRKARDSVVIPAELRQPRRQLRMSPAEVEAKFAAANPSFPKSAFHVTCYRDGELQEVRICLNKDLSPRAGGSGVGECAAGSMEVLPVR